MTKPIRILTAGLPPLQTDFVLSLLTAEVDLAVVANVSSSDALASTLICHPTDVILVWGQATTLVIAAMDVLVTHPTLGVVLVAGVGDTFIEARIVSDSYRAWPSGLIESVRLAARRNVDTGPHGHHQAHE